MKRQQVHDIREKAWHGVFQRTPAYDFRKRRPISNHPNMGRFGTVRALMLLMVFSLASSPADLWTGQLFDLHCAESHQDTGRYEDCNPTAQTDAFGLQISGRLLKLDSAGNRKAIQAWKDYVERLRAIDPDMKSKPVTAMIRGAADGDELHVDSIELR